jgi:hypothetical protein
MGCGAKMLQQQGHLFPQKKQKRLVRIVTLPRHGFGEDYSRLIMVKGGFKP